MPVGCRVGIRPLSAEVRFKDLHSVYLCCCLEAPRGGEASQGGHFFPDPKPCLLQHNLDNMPVGCRVGLRPPSAEVRFRDLYVETEVYADLSRNLPSVIGFYRELIEVGLSLLVAFKGFVIARFPVIESVSPAAQA